MALRFLSRHVQQTLVDHVTEQLDARGWISLPTNFGVTPITVIDVEPEFTSSQPIAPNTVAATITNELEDRAHELGGGLWSVEYFFAIDIFGDMPATAVSIAADVKALLAAQPVIPVRNYTGTTSVESDERIEFDMVTVGRPAQAKGNHEFRMRWRSVLGRMTVYFQP